MAPKTYTPDDWPTRDDYDAMWASMEQEPGFEREVSQAFEEALSGGHGACTCDTCMMDCARWICEAPELAQVIPGDIVVDL